MSYSMSLISCILRQSSQARLTIPSGSRVRLALLVWSASGGRPSIVRVRLNHINVDATTVETVTAYGVEFYRATADVTDLVKVSGSYSVDGISMANRFEACKKDVLYAGWSLMVLYEKQELVNARIVYCIPQLLFTAPSGIYDFDVSCLKSVPIGKDGRATVVAFGGDNEEGEYFYINDYYFGYNLYNGSTAPKLDILTFDTGFLFHRKSDRTSLTLRFWTYFTPSLFGGSVEGLIVPFYLTYNEL